MEDTRSTQETGGKVQNRKVLPGKPPEPSTSLPSRRHPRACLHSRGQLDTGTSLGYRDGCLRKTFHLVACHPSVAHLLDRTSSTPDRSDLEGLRSPLCQRCPRAFDLGPYILRKKYRRFIKKGGIPEEDLRIGGETIGENEAIVENECQKGFESEVAICRHLLDFQGKHIAKFYGTVSLTTKGVDRHPFEVSGILIEYIPSFQLFNLEEYEDAPPKESWEKIGTEVMSILDDLDKRNVLNRDPSTRNIITAKDDHRVVMIDFAMARVRRDNETDEEWELAKGHSCEESRIGGTLCSRGILKEWVPSEQWYRYYARRAAKEGWDRGSEEEEE